MMRGLWSCVLGATGFAIIFVKTEPHDWWAYPLLLAVCGAWGIYCGKRG